MAPHHLFCHRRRDILAGDLSARQRRGAGRRVHQPDPLGVRPRPLRRCIPAEAARPWINGYARAPDWFAFLALSIGGLLYLSSLIASRTANCMASIWRKAPGGPTGLPDNWIYKLRSSKAYIAFHEGLKRKVAPAFFAGLFLYLGFSLISHVSFNLLDVAGYTCMDHDRDSSRPAPISWRWKKKRSFPSTSPIFAPQPVSTSNPKARATTSRSILLRESNPRSGYGATAPLTFRSAVLPTKEPVTWYRRLYLTMSLPLRRQLFEDWFQIVLRYGRIGGEEVYVRTRLNRLPDPGRHQTDPPRRALYLCQRRGDRHSRIVRVISYRAATAARLS